MTEEAGACELFAYTQHMSAENAALKQRIAVLEHKLCLDAIGTHSVDCWGFGRSHYECAVREIERLKRLKP